MIVVLDSMSQQLQTTGEDYQQQNSQQMEDASSDQLKSNANDDKSQLRLPNAIFNLMKWGIIHNHLI